GPPPPRRGGCNASCPGPCPASTARRPEPQPAARPGRPPGRRWSLARARAMFSWVGAQFTSILSTYVLGVVSALMVLITPLVLTAMTLWMLLFGWAVLRNEVPETLPSFLWRVTKIGLVLAFA